MAEQKEKISKSGQGGDIRREIALIIDGMDFMSLSLALPQIMKEFNVSHMKAGALAHYKIPPKVFFVTELPKNPGGKVTKGKLIEQFKMA